MQPPQFPFGPRPFDRDHTRAAMESLLDVLKRHPLDGNAEIPGTRVRLIATWFLHACRLTGSSLARMQQENEFTDGAAKSIALAEDIEYAVVAIAARPATTGMCGLPSLVENLQEQYARARKACRKAAELQAGWDPEIAAALNELADLNRADIGGLAVMAGDELEQMVRETVRDEARVQVGNVVDEVTSGAAEGELSEHFVKRESDCRKTADNFLTAAVAVITALSATIILATAWLGELTPTSVLVKIAAGLPFAVLAGYLLRESARHREAARASAELAVRLRVVRAFADLEPEDRQRLRREFGMRVFLGTPATPDAAAAGAGVAGPGDPAATDDAGAGGLLAEAVGLLRQLTDAVGALDPRRQDPGPP